MPRPLRTSVGGVAYHVLTRANARAGLFDSDDDYQAFECVLAQAYERTPVAVAAYCIMPNHFHLVLCPQEDGQLSDFMQWLTVTHTQRWHAGHGTSGTGHLYQGRFKSFPIQQDAHFLTVARYVERNALRARLVRRAEDWRWGSLWRRRNVRGEASPFLLPAAEWPVSPPRNWPAVVNRAETAEELAALHQCVNRGTPYGQGPWLSRTVRTLGLESTRRPRGRPRKHPARSAKQPRKRRKDS